MHNLNDLLAFVRMLAALLQGKALTALTPLLPTDFSFRLAVRCRWGQKGGGGAPPHSLQQIAGSGGRVDRPDHPFRARVRMFFAALWSAFNSKPQAVQRKVA